MFKGPLHPFRPGRLSERAQHPVPPDVPLAAAGARSPYAPCDDDLERRRREIEVYRFLVALYPQLR